MFNVVVGAVTVSIGLTVSESLTLGGADISWLVGWFAAAIAYLLLVALTPGTVRDDPANNHDRLVARQDPPAVASA